MDRHEFLKLSGMAAAGLSSFDPLAALAAGEHWSEELKFRITRIAPD